VAKNVESAHRRIGSVFLILAYTLFAHAAYLEKPRKYLEFLEKIIPIA
jgi:hypothetical protein